MKRALQALLIAPESAMRRAVETGEKEITIQEGTPLKPVLTLDF